jgi:hypothetical protein
MRPAAASRLAELRLAALAERIDADLALGRLPIVRRTDRARGRVSVAEQFWAS